MPEIAAQVVGAKDQIILSKVQAHEQVHMGGGPCRSLDKTKCICCKYKSPIIIDKLVPRLNDYSQHNASAAGKLREGFSNGFKLGFEGVRRDRDALRDRDRDAIELLRS